MKAIQKALDMLGDLPAESWGERKHEAQAVLVDARDEVRLVQSEVAKALALRTFAAAGLSAFHGRLCAMRARGIPVPDEAEKCQDPKCRAWAAALKEET